VARFGKSSLILRPSVIIGAGDHTERLHFWIRLVAVHGKRLDIANRDPIVQLVDVRDLAQFTTRCVETTTQGAVNVCGAPVCLSAVLDSIEGIFNHTCERKTVHIEDLPKLNLERLPYCESGHLARHDFALAQTLGFVGRQIHDSLQEICHDFQRQGFAMQGFKAEEAAVLRLFL
jgi:nucleoside-diphosphate-sugar epimerase